jgi:dATP pyrophosphohydrolase
VRKSIALEVTADSASGGAVKPFKIPVSTLIVVYTASPRVLLIERADFAGHWQSVTGSQEPGESLAATATRELLEETGIDAGRYGGVEDWKLCNLYEIFPKWRHRYPPGTTHNMEHVFGLRVPSELAITLAPEEHTAACWLPPPEAAARCFSWSNREAILRLASRGSR